MAALMFSESFIGFNCVERFLDALVEFVDFCFCI